MNYREAAIRYLGNGPKSKKQIRDYLQKRDATDEETKAVIDFLSELGYLDDVKFSRGVFEREYEKARGKSRTVGYLKSKGVETDDIEEGFRRFLDEYEGQYDERAIALAEAKKMAKDQPLDEKLKGKIARRLATKGFSPTVIYSALDHIKRESKEDE